MDSCADLKSGNDRISISNHDLLNLGSMLGQRISVWILANLILIENASDRGPAFCFRSCPRGVSDQG
jgi:hypothetical protein